MSKSLRAWPTGSITCFMAIQAEAYSCARMSLRSIVVVAGSTMSACFAAGFHQGSWTITAHASVRLDPLLVHAGLSYRF